MTITMGTKILAVEAAALVSVIVAGLSDSNVALVIGLASLLATRIFDILDRRAEARKLKLQSDLTAQALSLHTATQMKVIKDAVEENTELTKEGTMAAKEAYVEANTVNKKIEQLGVSIGGKNTA
jgi:fructose-1-phosphate kinase PfkB-like protein